MMDSQDDLNLGEAMDTSDLAEQEVSKIGSN